MLLQQAQAHPGRDDALLSPVVQVALQTPSLGGGGLDQSPPARLGLAERLLQDQAESGHLDRHPGRLRQIGDPAPGTNRVPAQVEPGNDVSARFDREAVRLGHGGAVEASPPTVGTGERDDEIWVVLDLSQHRLDLLGLAPAGSYVGGELLHLGDRHVAVTIDHPPDEGCDVAL